MDKARYQQMALDELFAEFEIAAVNENDLFLTGGKERIKLQREWAARSGEIFDEIKSRGDEAVQRYIPFLQASHPAVRLSAALALRDVAPKLIAPVLEELVVGHYRGTVEFEARTALWEMRTEGVI
jgi:hypothetical protein